LLGAQRGTHCKCQNQKTKRLISQNDELPPTGVRGYFTVAFLVPGKFRKVNEWSELEWLFTVTGVRSPKPVASAGNRPK
jgi:hypothetical protein